MAEAVMDNSKYEAFTTCYSTLMGIRHGIDEITTKVFEKGLISREVKDKCHKSVTDDDIRALLDAIQERIKTQPKDFDIFVSILKSTSGLDHIGDRLVKTVHKLQDSKKGELVVSSSVLPNRTNSTTYTLPSDTHTDFHNLPENGVQASADTSMTIESETIQPPSSAQRLSGEVEPTVQRSLPFPTALLMSQAVKATDRFPPAENKEVESPTSEDVSLPPLEDTISTTLPIPQTLGISQIIRSNSSSSSGSDYVSAEAGEPCDYGKKSIHNQSEEEEPAISKEMRRVTLKMEEMNNKMEETDDKMEEMNNKMIQITEMLEEQRTTKEQTTQINYITTIHVHGGQLHQTFNQNGKRDNPDTNPLVTTKPSEDTQTTQGADRYFSFPDGHTHNTALANSSTIPRRSDCNVQDDQLEELC